MKIPKAAKRDARRLFRACFDNNLLEESRVRAAVAAIVREKPRHYLAILTVYERLVRLEIERNTARVESATGLSDDLRTEIQQQLQQIHHRPLTTEFSTNPSLIGGTRITVGSDVWDGSVTSRLEGLKSAL